MKEEKSCGAVIYKYDNSKIKYLLIHQNNGFWSFPKGHVESNETEEETAIREIKEETGLDVDLNNKFRIQIDYIISELSILKHVVFFIAIPKSDEVNIQEEELNDYKWLNYEDSLNLITYENSKDVLKEAHDYILKNKIDK